MAAALYGLLGLGGEHGQQPAFAPAAGYGATGGYEPLASVPVETPRGGVAGVLNSIQRKPYITGQRRRLNAAPLLICILLPWGLFVFVYWIASFSVRYEKPWLYSLAIVACGVVVFCFLAAAVLTRIKLFSSTERDPSWITFLALSMLLALAVGFVQGGSNYQDMRNYYDFHNLNTYTDIYPNLFRGQQLMDAGTIIFTPGTHLDISKSEGFKQGTMYCVAPIVHGNETPPTYDFWAVGTGCCGSEGDFHCKGWNSVGFGGLRLMNGGQRGHYRSAVQQAEASYGIKAVHPLFFQWTRDPSATVDSWERTARSNFVIWIFSYLLFQSFIVAAATMAFSRLGYL